MDIATDKFKDREEAAILLAKELSYLRGEEPLVLAIPRGAVSMAKVIADELEGDLDILLVHKLGHPRQPEYAIGAVNENGSIFITDSESSSFLGEEALTALAQKETAKLRQKRRLYTPFRSAVEVKGRVCVIVDDGIATGSTFRAAIKTLQEQEASRIIVAAPVASRQAMDLLRNEGVELCVLKVPANFFSVSMHFEKFPQVDDSTVVNLLSDKHHEATIELEGREKLDAFLKIPKRPKALVIFAHGSGSGRFSTRNQYVAKRLNEEGYATLLADLLTENESNNRDLIFDIDFLAKRVERLITWAGDNSHLKNLPVVLFGASTGAGAAIKVATIATREIGAVISRGGRVDLADEALELLHIPTLLIVGALDALVLDLNRDAMTQMKSQDKELVIVDNASHLFEEPGALEQVADVVIKWLDNHFCAEINKSLSYNEKENGFLAP